MFEKGNKLAAKSKLFEQTIKRALASEDYAALRRCADKVIALAEQGEQWAVLLLRDTLDGRPAQQVVATDADGKGLTIVLADLSAIGESRQPDCPALPLHSPTLPAADPNGTQEWH